MSEMKKGLITVVLSVLFSVLAAYGVVKAATVDEGDKVARTENGTVTRTVNLAQSDYPDLTYAAEAAVDAVVYVEVTVTQKYQMADPFFRFFFGDGEPQTREQQASLIWKYLKQSQLSQADRNVAFQILDLVLNPSLQSDLEMTARLRKDVSLQIPAVVREIRPGAVLVQKGQVITPALAKLLQSQGYPDAAFPLKHLAFILIVVFAWSFWPIWIENGLREKLSLREWIYVAVVLSLVWSLELLFTKLGGSYSMAVLGLTGWLCLTIPVSLSYHIIFGGGIISVMITYGTNPGIVASKGIENAAAAFYVRTVTWGAEYDQATICQNLVDTGRHADRRAGARWLR